jgi:hypothetical protein
MGSFRVFYIKFPIFQLSGHLALRYLGHPAVSYGWLYDRIRG